MSHAGQDVEVAHVIHGWLVAERHDVFLDRDPDAGIAVGDLWEQRLYDACGGPTQWSA